MSLFLNRRMRWLNRAYHYLHEEYGHEGEKSVGHLRDEATICRLAGESGLARLLDNAANWSSNVAEHVETEWVISIVLFGDEMTYDLEVDDDPHNFIANGFVVHNSGKTSIARAIATHFTLDLHYLTLSDLDKDAKLLQMISGVGSNGMLLLEDVDVLNATHDRDKDEKSGDEKGRISLSGLLNGLDGVASPHGLVVFLTTNHLERLDPALIRPGRVDMQEHIGYLDSDQIERLFEMSFGYTPTFPDTELPDLSASTVVGVLKQNLDDPDQAFKALSRILEGDDQ